jgi:DNA mismatch endonuclease (patch repair protein)
MPLDHVSPAVSSRMRAVSRANTDAEKLLQTALRRRRLYFRTHAQTLGCRPDMVFRSSRVVVFVDGDFWHGRTLVDGGPRALKQAFRRDSRSFWVEKITRNVTRDQRQTRRLRRHGWSVMRFWRREILTDSCSVAAVIAKRVARRKHWIQRSSDV